jgi:hypothetical protein
VCGKNNDNDMNFFLCFVKTRKKLDKYFKINRIRNKYIIDIKKILEDEKINMDDKDSVAFFKVLVWNRILLAQQKSKDVYYIPNFQNHDLHVSKLLGLHSSIAEYCNDFNLLLFHEEFIGTNWLGDVLENIDHFDHSQIIKDY